MAIRALDELDHYFAGRKMPLKMESIKLSVESQLKGLAEHCRVKGCSKPCMPLDANNE